MAFLRVLCSDALAHHDPFTQDALSPGLAPIDLERLLNLSRPSVSNLISHFEGVIQHPSHGPGAGTRVVLDPTVGVAVGVDFGHGHTSVAVTDLCGRMLAAEEVGVRDASGRGAPQVDWAATEIARLLDELGWLATSVAGVGIALPGPVDRTDEYAVIRAATSLGTTFQNPFQTLRPAIHVKEALVKREPEWRNVPFVVDNDANLSALGELTWGLAREAQNVIYLDWSSGIGGGLILNGEIYRGAGAAGEVGHIVVADATERGSLNPCPRCGNVGCLESVASLDVLATQLRDEIARIDDPSTVSALISLAQDGGPASEPLRRATDYLSRALAPLITALNPELVIIGGGFGTRAYDVIKNELLDLLNERTMPPANKDVTILGAIPPRLDRLPERARTAARRTALAGAAAAIVNPTRADDDPLITYLQQRA
jgi:predicted NBD/HSP70 family sugar kinase